MAYCEKLVLEVFSIGSSEIDSLGYNHVQNWRNNLNSNQSVDLQDSETPSLRSTSEVSNKTIQNIVVPEDSVSNVGEVVSEVISDSSVSEATSTSPLPVAEILQVPDPTLSCLAARSRSLIYTASFAPDLIRTSPEIAAL